MRLSIAAIYGPRINLTASSDGHIVTHGELGSGWTNEVVTIPVKPVADPSQHARVCFGLLLRGREGLRIDGYRTSPALAARDHDGEPLPGRVRIEYLRPGHSWWSTVTAVARRTGLGRAWSGTWIAFLASALAIATIFLASGLLLREFAPPRARLAKVSIPKSAGMPFGRLPPAAYACALIACLNAACWSILTPPFQVPDEPYHFAYVKQLAETRQLPSLATGTLSPEEMVVLSSLHVERVRAEPENRPIASRAEQDQLQQELVRADHFSGKGSESAGLATSQPPLYYALQAFPYSLASGGTPLDRLELMRLLSALMGGFTALFVFLFVREALPGVPWAWTVGGLGVALAPLLGLMSGSVNPDAMLFAVSAAAFYCLSRAFRRGLTRRSALALGAVTAVGLLTKLNFIGLAPGVLLGLILLSIRAARTSGRGAYWSLALAVVIACSPAILYMIVHLATDRPILGIVSSGIDTTYGSLAKEASYMWQLYLPRLPGMRNDFPGLFTTRRIWFDGYVGLYGWLDTTFPLWVYGFALVPAAALAALFIRALLASRAALRGRIGEVLVYLAMSAGLLALVGAASYRQFPTINAEYGQARYLLPLLPLLGDALALAARGAGRRWGPTIGTLIVLLFLAHNLFSQLLVVARFYG